MTSRTGSRYLLMAAAGAAALACVMAIAVSPFLGAALAAASTTLVLGGLVADRRRSSSANDAVVRKAAESAEVGRRLAIYERETGLLAHWYLSLRGKEECDRAARYQRALTLLLVETAPDSDSWVVQGQLADWLGRKVRTVDITGYLGNGRFAVLMPDTDIAVAQHVAARLQSDVAGAQIALASFGTNGVTFDDLYAAAQQSLRESLERAA